MSNSLKTGDSVYVPAIVTMSNGQTKKSLPIGFELATVFISENGDIALEFLDGEINEVGHWTSFFGDEVVSVTPHDEGR